MVALISSVKYDSSVFRDDSSTILFLFYRALAVANADIYDADCSAQPQASLQLILSVSGWTAAHDLLMCLKTNLEYHII